jgi:hypothetical protein
MPAIGMTLRALLIPLAGLVATAAWADESGSRWSIGTQIGQVHGAGDSAPVVLAADELSPMSFDASATWGDKDRPGWRVFTGYRFTDYLALHVGYADLGKVHSRVVDPERLISIAPDRLATQTLRGVDVGLQLKVPLSDRVDVELHGGKYYWKTHTTTAVDFGDSYRTSRRGSDDFFGAGISVEVINDLNATAGWTRYEVAGEPVSLMTIGLLYGFSYF